MMITKRTSHLTLLLAFFVISIAINSLVHAKEIILDQIAAIVNDDVVMISEVKTLALETKQKNNSKQPDHILIKGALEEIILEKIQLQRAKELGIIIDDVAVDRAMNSIASQNKLDLGQFRIELLKIGRDYKVFRESIRQKLYIESLRKRQQSANKSISESEVDDLIKSESHRLNKNVQYHLIDILIPTSNGTGVTEFNHNLKQAELLRKKLLGNRSLQSFNKTSQQAIKKLGAISQDLGWKSTQTLSPAFVRTLSLLGVGELSDIVRDERGFHILKIVEQRGGDRKITQQARVRHILISSDDPQAKVKVTILRNKILAGEDFAKLAKENSADKNSAIDGGNLGSTDPSAFVPSFAKAVKSLPLNSLSQPIQTQFGWHILEVLERKTTDQTREVLKAQAESLITQEKQAEKFNNWLQSLRDEAFVEYRI